MSHLTLGLLSSIIIGLASHNYSHAQSGLASNTETMLDFSKGNYVVEIYDAETIAIINAPQRPLQQNDTAYTATTPEIPKEPEIKVYTPQTPLSVTSTSSSVQSTPVKPRFPIDITAQYTDIDGNVPVIDDPKGCSQNLLDIDVRVENISKTKGLIIVDLHNDVKEDFLVWDKVVLRLAVPATKGAIDFCIPLTQPGDYAVVIYHDKDSDREFDKNFLGIPSEHFGMSQNPKFGLRSPEYEEAVFSVPESGAAITIQLRKASDIL